ncbi:hypothetical protein BVY03_01915 [bacterium K02(2017)]|nr:hypothetical protein BVY03_01915 [bacterium K02(2017)]
MLNSIINMIKKISWTNLSFLSFIHVTAIVGSIWTIQNNGLHPSTFILLISFLIMTGFGITVGYHRLFSHKSFETNNVIKSLLLLFGGACFEGSAREWCCAHRKHHGRVDQEGDPYNAKKGFFYSHIGWIVLKADQSDERHIQDMLKDPIVLFQDRHYVKLAVLIGFILPMALAALWGDIWGGLFIAGALRIVINYHFTWFINSYCHHFGKQPYSNKNSSRDSWFIALFTYGEGYHNFHHNFQRDFRNGIRFYQFDPSKWLIKFLAQIGLASNLYQTDPERILKAKLNMDEKRLKQKSQVTSYFKPEWHQYVLNMRAKIETQHHKLMQLKLEYLQIKKQKNKELQANLTELKLKIRLVKHDLNHSLNHWKLLINGQLNQLIQF